MAEAHWESFRRVSFQQAERCPGWTWPARLQQQEPGLCVVNTRRAAREVFHQLSGPGNFHLSTLMYPAHRKRILDEIRRRLRDGCPAGWSPPLSSRPVSMWISQPSIGSCPVWTPSSRPLGGATGRASALRRTASSPSFREKIHLPVCLRPPSAPGRSSWSLPGRQFPSGHTHLFLHVAGFERRGSSGCPPHPAADGIGVLPLPHCGGAIPPD